MMMMVLDVQEVGSESESESESERRDQEEKLIGRQDTRR